MKKIHVAAISVSFVALVAILWAMADHNRRWYEELKKFPPVYVELNGKTYRLANPNKVTMEALR